MEETPTPPRASVLIVCFNAVDALARCLTALDAAPDRATFEVIVVDNGSQDGTPALEHRFASTTFLKLPRNFGFTKAANIAMRTAKSEFFLFLDPRSEPGPGLVSDLCGVLEPDTKIAAVAPRLVRPGGEVVPQLYRLPARETVSALASAGHFEPAPAPEPAAEPVLVEFPSFAAIMVRAYFLRGLRYIDERYAQTWADAEVCYQIRRAGRKTLLAPTPCLLHDQPDPFAGAPGAVQTLLETDWITGAATFAAKHFGLWAGIGLRISAALRALAGVRLGLLPGIFSGTKLDGTQTSV